MNKSLIRKIIKNPHILGVFFGFKLLTELHSQWIRECWLSKEDNSLQAHRGSYKTTSIVILGVIWWLWFHFNDRIAIIRKDFTAAKEVLEAITKVLNSEKAHVIFKQMYGFDYTLTEETKQSITWSLKTTITVQGSISAYSMGEDMTGAHFDRIVIDDFVTIYDRVSKTVREKTKMFIQDVRSNIIEPGNPIIFTGTPWHKLDAWSILPAPKKYDVYTTKLKKFTEKYIKYLRTINTASMFAANYELKHIASDESLFDDPVYCKWDYSLDPVCHIDAKYKGSHTGAFTIMAMRTDGKVQAVGFMFEKHIVDEYDNLMSIYMKYRGGTVYLEENADKGYAARDLSAKGMLTSSYNESENKFVKIIQNLKLNWHLIEWAEETDPRYISQILDLQEGIEPDDCADSAASLIRQSGIFNTGGSFVTASEYEDNYRE